MIAHRDFGYAEDSSTNTNSLTAGKSFETPERVPFRLTLNMVDALGLTGTEGVSLSVRVKVYATTCKNPHLVFK